MLHQRIFLSTAEAKVVITATESVIGDKVLELKKNVDEALTLLDANTVKYVIVSTGRNNNDSSVDLRKYIHLEKACYCIHTFYSYVYITNVRLNPPPYQIKLGILGYTIVACYHPLPLPT